MMNVNLVLRHENDAVGTRVGRGDPILFLHSLNEHGFYVGGITQQDPHTLDTQWTEEGFEVIIGEADPGF